MMISVLVPTWRRPERLRDCLQGFAGQSRKADEVIVVIRNSDRETLGIRPELENLLPGLHCVGVERPGVVAALNRGLGEYRGDILAIVDDDAVPRPDWLERIEAHFRADDLLGGLGGRDFLWQDGRLSEGTPPKNPGTVSWYGRIVGQHHLATGPAREVDHLKGANMSYRSTAIRGLRFDDRLWGSGAEPGNETAFSLAVLRAGWRLVVDPAVAVDHYQNRAERTHYSKAEHTRGGDFSPQAVTDIAHNVTIFLMDHLRLPGRIVYPLWIVAVGTRMVPGFLQCVRLLLFFRDGDAVAKTLATQKGFLAGLRDWMKTRDRRPVAPTPPSDREPARTATPGS